MGAVEVVEEKRFRSVGVHCVLHWSDGTDSSEAKSFDSLFHGLKAKLLRDFVPTPLL